MTLKQIMAITLLERLQAAEMKLYLGVARVPATAIISEPDQATILLWDWLVHLGFFTGTALRLVTDAIKDDLHRFIATQEVMFNIVVADSRYVGWTGSRGWLDIETGDVDIVDLPTPVVTSITLHFNALLMRAKVKLSALQRKTNENRPGRPVPTGPDPHPADRQ